MQAERIPVRNVPADDLPEVLEMLLDRLGLQLWQRSTPDYTAYELRPSGVPVAPAPLSDENRKVLTDLLSCCLAWEPSVCVMGNVRAGDAAEALADVLGIGTDGVNVGQGGTDGS